MPIVNGLFILGFRHNGPQLSEWNCHRPTEHLGIHQSCFQGKLFQAVNR
jgi:hypothetical protein